MRTSILILVALISLMPLPLVGQGYPPEVDAALRDLNARIGGSYRLSALPNWYWEERTFPDASMECPARGVEYAPAETLGFLITFTVNAQVFEYRAALGSGTAVFCGTSPAARTYASEVVDAPIIATGEWEYAAVTGSFVPALAWSASGAVLAVSSTQDLTGKSAGMIRLYNPDDLTGEAAEIPFNQPVTALDFSASANANPPALVIGGDAGAILVIPLDPVSVTAADAAPIITMQTEANWDSVGVLAVSPDGRVIASAQGASDTAADGYATIQVWDAATGEARASIGVFAPITALDFSPDGALLAAGLNNGRTVVYDAANGDLVAMAAFGDLPPGDLPTFVRFSPDGALLATATGTDVRLLDALNLATISVAQTFAANSPVFSLDFSADGTLLAAAGGDPNAPSAATSLIELWEVETGAVSATLRGHTDLVKRIAFSPNSARLASLSDDGTLRVWDFSEALE